MIIDASMKVATKVMYGPSISEFFTAGSVSENENVKVVWQEGDWYYITYTVDSTGKTKSGYVRTKDVNIGDTTLLANNTKDIEDGFARGRIATKNGGPVYFGPGTSYEQAGGVDKGEKVYFLYAFEADSWKFIQYNVDGSAMKKRGWVSKYVLSLGKEGDAEEQPDAAAE